MELSERLMAVAAMVPFSRTLADIGTDHAYLPVWLVQTGKAEKALACDLRRGPLARARHNIASAGLEERITAVLSDGLVSLPECVDTVVLAGMGGRLMVSILSNPEGMGPSVLAGLSDLILEPQSETEELVRYLTGNGFSVIGENMVKDRGKFYPILHAVPVRGEKDAYEHAESYGFGALLLKEKHSVYYQYLKSEEEKTVRLLHRLTEDGKAEEESPKASRIAELRQKLDGLRAGLAEYRLS